MSTAAHQLQHADTCTCRGCLTEAITAAVVDALRHHTPAEPAQVLTADEAAAYLGVSVDTVYRGIRAGALPALKVGQTYRLSSAALDRLMDGEPVASGARGMDRKALGAQS